MTRFLSLYLFTILITENPSLTVTTPSDEFSIIGFHGDYTPPSPPPPASPPHPPSLSCEEDLQGVGSLNTVCMLNSSLNFVDDVYIEGNGTLNLLPGVVLSCPINSCSILINMTRDFTLGQNALIIAGSVSVTANNVSLIEGLVVNVTGLAGKAPAQTIGTPSAVHGAGGGHGGRGASCVSDNTKLPDDVWGGDAYSWSDLGRPWSYGSKGGTTSTEKNYGGEGGREDLA